MNLKKRLNKGESLAEVILIIGVFAILGLAVILLVTGSFRGVLFGGTQTQALSYARETWEAVQSLGKSAYGNLQNGTYGLSRTNGVWSLAGSPDAVGNFTRSVVVTDSYRDVNGIISATGTKDTNTKKVTTNLTWDSLGFSKKISLTNYFTNWDYLTSSGGSAGGFGGVFSNTKTVTDIVCNGCVKLSIANSKFWKCAGIIGAVNVPGSTVQGTDIITIGTSSYAILLTNSNSASFNIIDKSNIESPTLVATKDLGSDSGKTIVLSSDYKYAYVGTANGKIVTLNIQNPLIPVITNTLLLKTNAGVKTNNLSSSVNKIIASGTALYIGTNTGSGQDSGLDFFIANLASSSAPAWFTASPYGILKISLTANLNTISLSLSNNGKTMYALMSDKYLYTLNVSTSSSPKNISNLNFNSISVPKGMDMYRSKTSATTTLFIITANAAGDQGEFFEIDTSSSTNPAIKMCGISQCKLNLGTGANSVFAEGTNALIGLDTNSNKKTFIVVDTAPIDRNDNPIIPEFPVRVVNQFLSPKSYNAVYWNDAEKLLYVAGADPNAQLQIIHRSGKLNWGCMERSAILSVNNLSAGGGGQAISALDSDVFLGIDTKTLTRWNWDADNINVSKTGSISAGTLPNDILVTDTYALMAGSAENAGTNKNPIWQQIKVYNADTLVKVAQTYNTENAAAETIALNGSTLLAGIGSKLYKFTFSTSTGVIAATGTPLTLNANITKIRFFDNATAYVSTADTVNQIKYIKYDTTFQELGSINININSAVNDIWYKAPWLLAGTGNNQGDNFYVFDISATNTPASPLASINAGGADVGAGSGVNVITAAENEFYAFAGVQKRGQSLKVISLCGLVYNSASSTKSLLPRDECGLRLTTNDPYTIDLDSITNTIDSDSNSAGYIVGAWFNKDSLFLASTYNKIQGYIYRAIPGAAGSSDSYVGEGEYEQTLPGTFFSTALYPHGVNWNSISWIYSLSANCPGSSISQTKVKMQIKTGTTQAALDAATYVGPDMSYNSYYTENPILSGGNYTVNTIINPLNNGTNYIRYKATLVSDSVCTPLLQSVTYNYTPLP